MVLASRESAGPDSHLACWRPARTRARGRLRVPAETAAAAVTELVSLKGIDDDGWASPEGAGPPTPAPTSGRAENITVVRRNNSTWADGSHVWRWEEPLLVREVEAATTKNAGRASRRTRCRRCAAPPTASTSNCVRWRRHAEDESPWRGVDLHRRCRPKEGGELLDSGRWARRAARESGAGEARAGDDDVVGELKECSARRRHRPRARAPPRRRRDERAGDPLPRARHESDAAGACARPPSSRSACSKSSSPCCPSSTARRTAPALPAARSRRMACARSGRGRCSPSSAASSSMRSGSARGWRRCRTWCGAARRGRSSPSRISSPRRRRRLRGRQRRRGPLRSPAGEGVSGALLPLRPADAVSHQCSEGFAGDDCTSPASSPPQEDEPVAWASIDTGGAGQKIPRHIPRCWDGLGSSYVRFHGGDLRHG